ncbi:MAG: diphosphomevalonate decarboxylase [Candidatus Sericytochromatia bacterium]
MSAIIARAHSNIALIKYWGKRAEGLKLPLNGSLSLTLDQLYTDTRVSTWQGRADRLMLNGQAAPPLAEARVQAFLTRMRQIWGLTGFLQVDSVNHVPTAAGLASSASAFAALALAASHFWGLNLGREDLSRLAREGSGSACRSVYGGFAEWLPGVSADGADSYAVALPYQLPVVMAVLVLQASAKKTPSGEGMARTVATSPLYPGWLETVQADLQTLKAALAAGDLQTVGETMEHNALAMHASALAARPAVLYWQPESVALIQHIWALRAEGHACWLTMDAGPNVKVLLPAGAEKTVEALRSHPAVQELILCRPGPAAHLLASE